MQRQESEGTVVWTMGEVEEVHLNLEAEGDVWVNNRYVLVITGPDADEELRIHLDGLHVNDIIQDAKGQGVPTESAFRELREEGPDPEPKSDEPAGPASGQSDAPNPRPPPPPSP